MSMKRSFLPRRIIHRSFALSKSRKEGESEDLRSVCNGVDRDRFGREGKREDDDRDNGRGKQRQCGVASFGELGLCESGSWAGMLPELLGEIMQRVEASEEKWPERRNVVACACVCKRWRDAAKEAVEKASLIQPGKITFPSSLKKVFSLSFFFFGNFLLISSF